jgi:hypothetical protein
MTWAAAATRIGVAAAHNITPDLALSTDPVVTAFTEAAINAAAREMALMHQHLAICIINQLGEAVGRGR